MDLADLNPFDAALYAVAAIATFMGLRTGLMRALAAILGYGIAAPVAVMLLPRAMPFATSNLNMAPSQSWIVLCGLLFIIGAILSTLLRLTISELTGKHISLADRLGGALLGALRIGLLAVVIVLIFDRVIPAGQEPWFLAGSKTRPYLSQAGEKGLHALPPEVEAQIEKLKRERGL